MVIRQYLILLKRANKRILNLLLAAIIPLTAFWVKELPEEDKRTNFVCGYYMEESDRYLTDVQSDLAAYTSCFVFEKCDSLSDLKAGVASGKYDCGYAFEAGFSDTFISDVSNSHILLFQTPSSMFSTVFSEMIFGRLLTVYSPAIASNYLKTYPATKPYAGGAFDDYLESAYAGYMNSDSVFRLSVNATGTYRGESESVDLFPVRKMSGFLLYVSALFGLLCYLRDQDQRIYDRVSGRKRLVFCILNLLANTTIMFLSVLLTLWIYEVPEHPFSFCIQLIGYLCICLLFALVCLLIFRHYKRFASALPAILLCTLIFSPVFLDLRGYAMIFRFLAYLFPTTYIL